MIELRQHPGQVRHQGGIPAVARRSATTEIDRRSRPGAAPSLVVAVGPAETSVPRADVVAIRARRLLEARITFVGHPSFNDSAIAADILAPMPGPDVRRAALEPESPEGPPASPAALWEHRLLTREQEVHLFQKMNFLKHQASRLLRAIDLAEVKAADLDLVEAFQGEALAVRNQIIRGNLRLVVSVVKKLSGLNRDFAELVSDGHIALMRAVEKFDVSRGYRFSTYASWVIINSLLRDSAKDRRRGRFVTGRESMLEAAPDHRNDESPCEMEQARCRKVIRGMLRRLNDRERRIIVSRFGLEGTRQKTLNQLGEELGITKERVRQIETRARDKLREIAEAEKFDLLDF
jgi:RNA polymerase primary sigma factor